MTAGAHHVGLGPAPHLDADVLVVTGQEDCLPLHRLVLPGDDSCDSLHDSSVTAYLPGDDGGGEAPRLAVQGQVGAHGAVRVLGGGEYFANNSGFFRAFWSTN